MSLAQLSLDDQSASLGTGLKRGDTGLQFSLFYFDGKGGTDGGNKYELLLEGAKFADRNGFTAVWTPERHFHPFGGLYPNPSLTSAALATVTQRIQLRAGSVVAPLHSCARIAEEWALVDNLSGGRAGISFASGWHVNDFALNPSRYAVRKEAMVEAIGQIRRLWRGDSITLENGNRAPIEVRVYPRPIQEELPMWVTCSGSLDTFEIAGRLGTGVLTHLLGQSLEELENKIGVYRRARAESGFSGPGHVTLMMHTFIGDDPATVRETIRQPFGEYISSSLSLIQKQLEATAGNGIQSLPWRRGASATGVEQAKAATDLDQQAVDELAQHAFTRYSQDAALFGTPDTCLCMLDRLGATGVNEVACLIDFGVSSKDALRGLEKLAELQRGYHDARTRTTEHQRLAFNEELSVS